MALVGVAVVLVLFVAGLTAMVITVALVPRPEKRQFSLRTLMLGVTLVAVALSAVMSWRYLNLAKIEWLDPASEEARLLWTDPVVVRKGDEFTAEFRPTFRNVDSLYFTRDVQQPGWSGSFGTQTNHSIQTIELRSSDESFLEGSLAAMAEADVPKEGWFAVRGVVENRGGRPVSNAAVDLMGPFVYVNHFTTRADGTFTMPIQAPPGRGYYFRIRYDNRRMNTARFALSDESRELVVRVRVK